jgi:hypothetical protein
LSSYLHLNVENTCALLLADVLDSLHTGAVVVAAKLSVLDETLLLYQLQKVVFCDKVIFTAILLGASGLTSRVWFVLFFLTSVLQVSLLL